MNDDTGIAMMMVMKLIMMIMLMLGITTIAAHSG